MIDGIAYSVADLNIKNKKEYYNQDSSQNDRDYMKRNRSEHQSSIRSKRFKIKEVECSSSSNEEELPITDFLQVIQHKGLKVRPPTPNKNLDRKKSIDERKSSFKI